MQYPRMPKTTNYRRKGTRRLRLGRYSNKKQIYHLNVSTHNRSPVFTCLANGRLLVRAMMRAEIEGHANTLAFVIMPDHLHWLLQLTSGRPLSICIGAVKSESSRRIRYSNRSTEPVWQSGFYDRALRQEEDIADVARYMIANPVRAGIVDSVRQYALWDSVWV